MAVCARRVWWQMCKGCVMADVQRVCDGSLCKGYMMVVCARGIWWHAVCAGGIWCKSPQKVWELPGQMYHGKFPHRLPRYDGVIIWVLNWQRKYKFQMHFCRHSTCTLLEVQNNVLPCIFKLVNICSCLFLSVMDRTRKGGSRINIKTKNKSPFYPVCSFFFFTFQNFTDQCV